MNAIALHARVSRKALRKTALFSVLAAILVIVAVSVAVRSGPLRLERWQLALLLLPWVAFFASFLPLLHDAWFSRELHGVPRVLLAMFYWVVVACTALIFLGIYAHCVFRLV